MEPTTFVLFGATGDLAKRKIYPALFNLFLDGKLPEAFSLIGLGRRELTDESFRANVERSLREFSRRQADDAAKVDEFLQAFGYNVLEIGRKEDYLKLLGRIEERENRLGLAPNRLFYLSVGPEFFETIAANIQESGLGSANGWKRLVIEKPFGNDLQTARELNRMLGKAFAEEEIFRIDHYLGKPMVQMLKVLQQTNPVIQAIWNNRNIANVQITAGETVGVEERAGYYDHVGAIRDMFQNHMLQLLMMTAIRTPHKSDAEQVRYKKKLVMEALEPLQKADVGASVVRGQYAAGTIKGNPVVGYTSEPGIAPDSMNDTFVAAKLTMDDSFWRGVPFYIRTGKRMKEKATRIVIEFKEPLKQSSGSQVEPNLLVIEMSPTDSIRLQLNTMDSRSKGEFKPVQIDIHSSGDELPEAYENLIRDALLGDSTFFAHWDEVEASWAWVQPILEAYEENIVPLHAYEAGSYGPAESDALLARDGYHWWFDAKPELDEAVAENKPLAHINQ
ncbi:glucose-6-phosphate dehydrogenase [Paenibacillus soyae]|uniref:Glucose-6-phosphate 1-dehydrogenase n=1 Tax=Paenibacillus soyae TaxID=2969249 RepID=A0A9X2MWW2_9BACL|nr:glucose-6-phosphate dehydrogenase [Paenibacillus soyae]MCR2807910.1 glucose-6-phosphate dehydrogenase [Paenibacillus soyae]